MLSKIQNNINALLASEAVLQGKYYPGKKVSHP